MISGIKEFFSVHQNDIVLVIGVILISLLSFAMGYIVAKQHAKEPFQILTDMQGNSAEKQDLIQVTLPKPGDKVASPLEIHGQARGNWYFEASFPIKIKDSTGKELGVAVAQAQGDWMTTDFVPFTAILQFQAPTAATGTIYFEKDNPSGLPANADELHFQISF
jgi:hypothetical protein